MKSALAKRLVLTAAGCGVVLCVFIGVNIGYELPADRIGWFMAAGVLILAMLAYSRYAFRSEPAVPKAPSNEPAPHAAGAQSSAHEEPDRSQQHAS